MKTNSFTILILLLSFSFASAQDQVVTLETENIKTVSYDNITVENISVEAANKKETFKADSVKEKETLAKSYSDIRVYLNRTRKIENIKWLFPKINRAKVA